MNNATKRKWTGGEWRARSFNDGSFKVWQVTSKRGLSPDNLDVTVCDVYNGVKPEIAQANTYLLAGSKKLFEACEWAANSFHHPNCRFQKRKSLNCDCAVGACQAALQAALGEGV